jgi:hypothetical protein
MRRHLRLLAVLVAGLLTVTIVAGPAQAAPRHERAANWLSRQLTNGLIHNDQFDFDDYGLTADVAYALKPIHGHGQDLRDIRGALADHVNDWTRFGGNVSAGSTAKALVLAQVTGADEASFGGVNLVGRLNHRVRDSGRIQDQGTDFANTIGQAYAARGLSDAGSGKADKVVGYLLKQQCSRGYFRLSFPAPGKPGQTCESGKPGTSAPDTDVTAIAALSLRAISPKTAEIRSAITDAIAWLKKKQKRNGSFGGGPATEASNTNSTGLAAWVLGDSGACGAAAKAARWVRDLQVPGGVGGTPLAGDTGAIAYNRAAYNAGESDGIGDDERDQWRRATSQAAPGLAFLAVKDCREK